MQKEIYLKQKIEEYADMVYRIALTRCQSIENAEDIFDIRLSPTFYIIDSEKKIILKNAPVEEVIQTIKNLVE